MIASASTHSLSSSAALPDDIRLKCSYYSSEIKTQVTSLYEEQHKWLEDHLIEIKDTMVKATQKKAGTRAVMAGIIKTPSRKRNKKLSKKNSKPDHLGGPSKPPNPPYPLSELQRNINSMEIQEIIQQQLQKERDEIELRLQQELSSLDHQYESPVKKSSKGSALALGDRANQSPTSLWKPVGAFIPSKSTATSSISDPFHSADVRFPLALPSALKQSDHPEPVNQSLLQQDPRNDESPMEELRVDSRTSSYSAGQLDVDDAFATAGHELSAIQEGEEEEDAHCAPPTSGSLAPRNVAEEELIKVQKSPEPNQPSTPASPLPIKSTTPAPQSKNISPPVPHKVATPPSPPETQQVPIAKSPVPFEKPMTSVEPSPRQALSVDTSSAPDTNSIDAGASNSDPVAPPILQSSEPMPTSMSPAIASPMELKVDATVASSQVATSSSLVNAPPSQQHPITYPFALLPSAMIAPPPDLPSAVRALAENQVDDRMKPGSSMSLSTTSGGVHLLTTGTILPTLATSVPPITQPSAQFQSHEVIHSTKPTQVHTDTVVEVPLNDNPSSIRNNLYSSIGAGHSEMVIDHHTRTPGEFHTNPFTPGNTRAATIQSPHSKWSSKPSGASWTHKPLKTPAANSNLADIDQLSRRRSRASGSPGEDFSKPFNLLSSLQSTAGQVAGAPVVSSMPQSTSLRNSQEFRRVGLKRTSTDAGFNHTSDTHDAKMSRSHTPGLMNVRSSTTGGAGRKGMEDLKSRLSKIQRESAMHERVHHPAPNSVTDAPINPSTAFVAHNNASSYPKSTPLPNLLPLLAPETKTSTLVINRTIAHDQQETVRSQAQTAHQNFTAPVDLLASDNSQATHPVTEPINLHSFNITSKPLDSSSAVPSMPVKSGNAQIPVVDQLNLQRRSSSNSSVSNIVASYETKKKASDTEIPIGALGTVEQSIKAQSPHDTAPLHPVAKVESKHLAFLKGISSDVEVPMPSVATLPGSPKHKVTQPAKSIDSQTSQEQTQQQTNTDANVEKQVDCEVVASNQSSESAAVITDNESGNASNEDNPDHETQSEKEERLDDKEIGDLSIEIISSQRTPSKHVDTEVPPSDEDATNQIHPRKNLAHSEMTKTPRNVPTKPLSPVSTGFMGVFKAGAALATSWTTGKPKPELKSLQLAAAAAKKDQDEKDRKATLKQERRLVAAEKKQAEERAKAENERKARLAEVEKKKQEREEKSKAHTGLKSKVPLNHSATQHASAAEEAAKKRKIDNEQNRFTEKKVKAPQQAEVHTATKLPSSTQKATSSYLPTRTAPTAPGSAIKPTGSKNPAGSTSAIKQPTQPFKPNPPSRPPSQASQYNGGPSGKNNAASSQLKASQVSQTQSSSVTTITKNNNQKIIKAKTKKTEKEEYIELPDIDSEYSDDDESEHERKEAKLPDWAQSPALREALANQRKVNPDDVFGGSIPPPRMEEIFRDRASKFRHRTSSANWTGPDGLTALEEAEYAKRMGYHSKSSNLKK